MVYLLGVVLIGVLRFINCGMVYEYPKIELEDWCNQSVTLACPSKTSSDDRAGTLHFWIVPEIDCVVLVKMEDGCLFSSAIYLNLRFAKLADNDYLEIFENLTFSAIGRLVKKIPGGKSPRNDEPQSVAQLITEFTRQPMLTFNLFISNKGVRDYTHEVTFDYNILKDETGPSEIYCDALQGYVHQDTICEDASKSLGVTRVNCPSSYRSLVGFNPATGLQPCPAPSMVNGNEAQGNKPEKAWTADLGSYLTRLVALEVTGIIIGMILLVCIVVGMLVTFRYSNIKWATFGTAAVFKNAPSYQQDTIALFDESHGLNHV